MTPTDEARMLRMVEEIHTIVTKQMGGGLVGDGQQHPTAPTELEVASNPGEYFQTQYDIFKGTVTSQQVIDLFSPPEDDGEGGVRRKFVGGSLYGWAKADLPGLMRYYAQRFKVPLIISKLHPEQRKLIGL